MMLCNDKSCVTCCVRARLAGGRWGCGGLVGWLGFLGVEVGVCEVRGCLG